MIFSGLGESDRKYHQHLYIAHKAELRRKHLLRAFGISPEDYAVLFERQNGVCAICSKPPLGKRLAVDHDHTTLKVRGLLCASCNTKLGWYETNRKRILQYLS